MRKQRTNQKSVGAQSVHPLNKKNSANPCPSIILCSIYFIRHLEIIIFFYFAIVSLPPHACCHASSLRNKICCRTYKNESYILSACVFTHNIQTLLQIVILFSTRVKSSFFLWNAAVSLQLPQMLLFPVHISLASFLSLLLITFQSHQLEQRQLEIDTGKISIFFCFLFKFNMKKEEILSFNSFNVYCSHHATDFLLHELQTPLETEFHEDQQETCQTWSRIPGCWSVAHTRHLLAVPEGDKTN